MYRFDINDFVFIQNINDAPTNSNIKNSSVVHIYDENKNYFATSSSSNNSIKIGEGLFLVPLRTNIKESIIIDLTEESDITDVQLVASGLDLVKALKRVKSLEDRLTSLERDVVALGDKVTKLESSSESTSNTVSDIGTSISTMNANITDISDRVNMNKLSIDNTNSHIATVDNSIVQINSNIVSTNNAVLSNTTNIDNTTVKVDKNILDIQKIDTRVQTLENANKPA